MTEPLFTIGHSNRSIGEFLALLSESGIELVVDVRRLPGSRRNPQFDQDTLAESLHQQGIALRRADALTGRRPVSRTIDFAVNAWWQNRSFHNYADHALSEEFAEALAELSSWSERTRLAVMCSEAVWWRCHRRIIADHLLAQHLDVRHIVGEHHVEPAQLSPGAVIGADGRLTYPAITTYPAVTTYPAIDEQ